jgi:hypothetical protein
MHASGVSSRENANGCLQDRRVGKGAKRRAHHLSDGLACEWWARLGGDTVLVFALPTLYAARLRLLFDIRIWKAIALLHDHNIHGDAELLLRRSHDDPVHR